ncbi:unnamed protein product [Cuscuta epithymum]|uniref:F-box domain-containing protein n=1 Tax=Cuscuta epithymum TaxID=186058 RepID=A0AAV0DE47_9ASTE|nr:unnamed protein product [Cuscuta epithymum]
MDDIPSDIIEEILSKLPVRSLLRFRCVSRPWKSLISEPWFTRKHVTEGIRRRPKLVFNHDGHRHPEHKLYIYSVYMFAFGPKRGQPMGIEPCKSTLSSVSNQCLEGTTNLTSPPPLTLYEGCRGYIMLKVFCPELWCVSVGESLFLWNPSLSSSSYVKLPDPPPPLPGRSRLRESYGVGYDARGDDYKLLRVHQFGSPAAQPWTGRLCMETHVYSLRRNAWRKIQNHYFPPAKSSTTVLLLDTDSTTVPVGGALHWIGYPIKYNTISYTTCKKTSVSIVSFDLSSERYGLVPQSKFFPISIADSYCSKLTVLKGMLCVYVSTYAEKNLALWAMKDYGVEESWTKLCDVPHPALDGPSFSGDCKFTRTAALHLYEDGKLLLMTKLYSLGEIVILNSKEDCHQPISRIIVPRESANEFCDAFVYVESLVSPMSYLGQAKNK